MVQSIILISNSKGNQIGLLQSMITDYHLIIYSIMTLNMIHSTLDESTKWKTYPSNELASLIHLYELYILIGWVF